MDYILHLNPVCDAYGVGGAIADAPMIDYSLDIVEVNGEDRSKRGKRGGRKRLLQLKDGSRRVLPASAPVPQDASEVLQPLNHLYSPPPDTDAIRDRVLGQLATGQYPL